MKPDFNSVHTFQLFPTGYTPALDSIKIEPVHASILPLSLPVSNSNINLENVTPLDQCHSRLVQTFFSEDSLSSDFQPVFNRVVHYCVELNAGVELGHKIKPQDFNTLLNLNIKLCLHNDQTSFSSKTLTSQNVYETSIRELVDIFKPEHIEVAGSTARSLLAGTGILDTSTDIDIRLHLDLKTISPDRSELNKKILDLYADHYGFPEDNLLRKKSIKPFIDHPFGCTFKPRVVRSESHTIDITFIDINRFGLNASLRKSDYFPVWDNLQSSKRVLSSDGVLLKTQGLLTMTALDYLNARGLIVFNPLLTEKKLERIAKAIKKNNDEHKKIFGLQPYLIQKMYKESNCYEQFIFNSETRGLKSIPELAFDDLLNEHAALYYAHQQQHLTVYDVKSIEVFLAEAAYKQMRVYNQSDLSDHLLLKAQYAYVAGKYDIAEELVHQLLSKPLVSALHPIAALWLEKIVDTMPFQKRLTSKEFFHWFSFGCQSKTISVQVLQHRMDLLQSSIQTCQAKNSISSDDILKEINAIRDNHLAVHLIHHLHILVPDNLDILQEYIQRLNVLNTSRLNQFEDQLSKVDLLNISHVPILLNVLELGLKHDWGVQTQLWQKQFPLLLQSIIKNIQQPSDFKYFNSILEKYVDPKAFIDGVLAQIEFSSRDLESFLQEYIQFPKGSVVLDGFHLIQAQRFAAKQNYDKSIETYHRLFDSAEYSQTAFERAVNLCVSTQNANTGLAVLSHFFTGAEHNLLNKVDFNDKVKLVISKLGSSKINISLDDLKYFKQLQPWAQFLPHHDTDLAYMKGLLNLSLAYLDKHQNTLQQDDISFYSHQIERLMPLLNLDEKEIEQHQNLMLRVQGYSYKRYVDGLLPQLYETRDEILRNDITAHTKKSLIELDKISDENASDLIHFSELILHLGVSDEALSVFKSAMTMDDQYVSHHLGRMILGLQDQKKIMAEIDYFKKYIIQSNLQKKPVNLTLFIQVLVAMKGKEGVTKHYEKEHQDLAVKFLLLCKDTKFTPNKFICNFYEHNTLEVQDQELSALQWGLQALSETIDNQHAEPKTVYLEFLKQCYGINKYLALEQKTQHLTDINNKELFDADADFTLARNINKLLNSQINLLYKSALNQNYFVQAFSNQDYIDQLLRLDQLRLQFNKSCPLVHDVVRHYDIRASNILKSCQLMLVLNSAPVNEQGLARVLAALTHAAESLQTQYPSKNFKATFKDMLLSLKHTFGEHVGSYLSIQADILGILSLVVDANVPLNMLKTLNNRFNRQQLISIREVGLSIFKSLPAGRSYSDGERQLLPLFATSSNLLTRSIYASPHAGEIFLLFENEITPSVSAIMQFKFAKLAKKANQVSKLNILKVSSAPPH